MSHQDKDDLRTPLAQLKELIQPVFQADLDSVARHGNAQLKLMSVAVMALLTFGWNQKQTLGRRFDDAQQATGRSCGWFGLAGSYQALMVALRSCGNVLCQKACSHLLDHLSQEASWKLHRRPTFAVDGSQFAVPRTKKNLATFAAAGRKSKAVYKTDADYSKAKTTQIAVSLCLHLTTGFPAFWNFGGSGDSERGLLLALLDSLPKKSRLVMDAYYFGYQFWNRLIDEGFTFVVRAGKNIDLLGELKLAGKVKCRGDLVLYWPQTAIDAGGDPIPLSLVQVMVGRKKMFLLTNELDLTEKQLADLYARRWGVEVFFRTVKQSFERSKLLSRTPANVKQEIQWTLLGVWLAMTEGSQQIPSGRRMSPVRVLRTLCDLVSKVAQYSNLKTQLYVELSQCVIADESNRKSEKNSKDYPRKKRKRQAGEPTVKTISPELRKLALTCVF